MNIVEQFERDGYVIVPNVLDSELVAQARNHIEWLKNQNPDVKYEDLGTGVVKMDPFWLHLVSDGRLLDIAEQFIGPNIALFATHYIAKPPHTGRAVPWHQDGSFWPLEPVQVITFWLSLDEVTPENGCMRVLPGTQNAKLLSTAEMKSISKDEYLFGLTIDPATIDDTDAVDIILKPGDVSIHNPNIVHGSNPNNSDRWRRGLTIRYIPTITHMTNPDHQAPFLLRGETVPGINDYEPIPAYDEAVHLPVV
ncbi:MAG: phytanoyl-CoA dioxygenase family protein [Chloroflexi bacterium]|nr:phytanoyl-CoA dioxygenase family protein [Chloroflexota bacterium]